jgi:hypothetical protein
MSQMMVGIQIHDNDPRTSLEQKVNAAKELHKNKVGFGAKICLVSEKNAEGVDFTQLSKACGLLVKPTRLLPIHHLWIGAEKEIKETQE